MKTSFPHSGALRPNGRGLSRRTMLQLMAGAAACAVTKGAAAAEPRSQSLGICSISYLLRWPKVMSGQAPLAEILEFIRHCERIGAAGVQTTIPIDPEAVRGMRRQTEMAGLFLEGQVPLPKTESDVSGFETRVAAAKEAGAAVLRTACLSGRRYEVFTSAEAFREFARQAERSLTLAEPVVRRLQMRLAIENHKDWRVPELLALLGRMSSEYIGVCVDTGNSIALLEDPMAVVDAFAPYAFTTHLKDMAVQECESGFLLAETPLGTGFLDLPAIVATLRRARPDVRLCLEMITRDPLLVPCLAKPYWATFESLPGSFLAATLAMVRAHPPRQPLRRISALTTSEKVDAEDEAVRKSLAFSRARLES